MSIVLGILTLIASFVNYTAWASGYFSGSLELISLLIQGVLTFIMLLAGISYNGKRMRKSYDGGAYRIFTLPFSVILLSILGNGSVFVVLLLKFLRIVKEL
ncbi:MAG: hypothetical protein LBM95_08845 [Lactobacillales bacterium]|jgi:hypothetical protein|nr:hypothetical protein [Lactobacillales bacterium]